MATGVRVRLLGPEVGVKLIITGLVGLVKDWRPLLRIMARGLQNRIAEAFEVEEYGGGSLNKNTQEYDEEKLREGWDLRRGHRTGELQDRLFSLTLFTVDGPEKGVATITLNFRKLQLVVDYAKWYQRRKAKKGLLTALAPDWVREIRGAVKIAAPAIARKLDAALGRREATVRLPRRRRRRLRLPRGARTRPLGGSS